MKHAGAAALALFAITGPAFAGGSVKDAPAPAEQARRCSYSINAGLTSEYVFRGIGQSVKAIDDEYAPALQGGADLTCGMFYAGVWASSIDFGLPVNNADIEVDLYAGIKPTWGKATFDLGVIYYAYPGATEVFGEIDYVELKAGVSGPLMDKLTGGLTFFYSPDYTFETGNVLTIEGTLAYELPAWGKITPTISGLLAYQTGDAGDGYFTNIAGTDDDYLYWNVGLALAIDKVTLDFRYWDTDIGSDAANICGNAELCDARFVASAKITLP
jgi:uncharacterized protein (TIGR02001 family)